MAIILTTCIINDVLLLVGLIFCCVFCESNLEFQYLPDLDDDEVAEMTKKKQRDCEVNWVCAR